MRHDDRAHVLHLTIVGEQQPVQGVLGGLLEVGGVRDLAAGSVQLPPEPELENQLILGGCRGVGALDVVGHRFLVLPELLTLEDLRSQLAALATDRHLGGCPRLGVDLRDDPRSVVTHFGVQTFQRLHPRQQVWRWVFIISSAHSCHAR
jgi:hypothetical protein